VIVTLAVIQPEKAMPDEKDDILYPASTPFNKGALTVDNHTLHYEEYGKKNGIPIVYLHGGPGAGCAPYFHRFFDPEVFRVIVYDQRGAPKSEPPGDITNNSPAHLVEDNEKLRQHLGIDKWHLFGGSWGSTLALLYAEKYPEHTSSMTLRGVFMMREQELDWYLNRMGTFFPEVYKEFIDFLPEAERRDVLESYYQRLINPDPAVHLPAAAAWTRFENGCAFLDIPPDEIRNDAPEKALPFARIEAHFMRNHMPDDTIMLNVGKIKDIPTAIVQGRHDNVCPPMSAFDLAGKLGNCSLEFVQSGHSGAQPETMKRLVAATDRIRDTGSPVMKQSPVPAPRAPEPGKPGLN
jgi:proline iminopeptidase